MEVTWQVLRTTSKIASLATAKSRSASSAGSPDKQFRFRFGSCWKAKRSISFPFRAKTRCAQRVLALNGKEIDLFAFQHEPNRNRNCLSGLPADDADLDLAVASEAIFEVVLRTCHVTSIRFSA